MRRAGVAPGHGSASVQPRSSTGTSSRAAAWRRRFTAWQEARDQWADDHPDTDLPIPPDMPWNPEDDQP